MNIKQYVKLYSIPVIMVLIGLSLFVTKFGDNDAPATIQQTAVAGNTTQAKIINAVAVAPKPAETNAGPRLPELVTKAQSDIADPTEKAIIVSLLSTKKTGDFVSSLRDQSISWLDTAPENRSRLSPLSPKQIAWAGYVVSPSTYPYPYSIVELYPDGKPK